MYDKDNNIKSFMGIISGISPLIMGLLWFFNVYFITDSNSKSIAELKTMFKELHVTNIEVMREIEIIKTTLKIKLK